MADPGPFTAFTHSDSYETWDAGATIFTEGDPGDFLYVVRTGSVDLLKGAVLLETVSEGGAFGEMALTGRPERSATAVAREKTTR